MPSAHAKLSPSAAERWLSCPASIRMAETVPEAPDSVYAQEGTIAHALAEIEGRREFGQITDKEFLKLRSAWEKDARAAKITTEQIEAMEAHVADLLELIHERMELYPNSVVFFEQRMDSGIPTCWGTSDVVIVSPQHVEIIDLKYGQGIAVSAVNNPQGRLYALGAYDTFGVLLGDVEVVRITIFQPRLDSTSTEELAVEELLAWREEIRPIAEEALGDDARFGPSEKGCRFCPVAGQCRPQMEWATRLDFEEDPEKLSPEEIGDLLGDLSGIKKWCEQVEARALELAYSEETPIPGHKVVMSGSVRTFNNPDAAIAKMVELGFAPDQVVNSKIKGFGDLDALLKTLPKIKPEGASRERFVKTDDVLGELISKTPGKPALVSEDDKRPAVSPNSEAKKEFAS